MKQQLPSVSSFRANMHQQQSSQHGQSQHSGSMNSYIPPNNAYGGIQQSQSYNVSHPHMMNTGNHHSQSHSYGSNHMSNHHMNSMPYSDSNHVNPAMNAVHSGRSPLSSHQHINGSNPSSSIPPPHQPPQQHHHDVAVPPQILAGCQNTERKWSKKKKRKTNPSQRYARMEVTWNFVTDFGNEGHHILLKHIQDPESNTTERLLYLDGEEVVNERSDETKFELDIGDDEVDVVIEHNAELTRYDYLLYINDVEYGDKVTVTSRRTTGTKGRMISKPISSAELKKKDPKRWAEINQLKVKEEKERQKKTRKRLKKDGSKRVDSARQSSKPQKRVEKKWGFVGFGPFGTKKKNNAPKKEQNQRRSPPLEQSKQSVDPRQRADESLPSTASSPRMQQNVSSTSEIWHNGPPPQDAVQSWNGNNAQNAYNGFHHKYSMQNQLNMEQSPGPPPPRQNNNMQQHEVHQRQQYQEHQHPAQLHQSQQVVTDEWEDTESEYETDSQQEEEEENQQNRVHQMQSSSRHSMHQIHAPHQMQPGSGSYDSYREHDYQQQMGYRQPEPGSMHSSHNQHVPGPPPPQNQGMYPSNGMSDVQQGMQQMAFGQPPRPQQQQHSAVQYDNGVQANYGQQNQQFGGGRQHHLDSNVSSAYNEDVELKKEDESSSSYATDSENEEW